ncbi:hypothetical protein TSMEX_003535 [Taenia solium]|eukprot:TsM_000684300 transcript=TsM_000684300 gene=TsM_000684300
MKPCYCTCSSEEEDIRSQLFYKTGGTAHIVSKKIQ